MASAISHFHTSPHHSVVRVAGELDLVTAPLLRAALRSADGDAMHEFVVEFDAVTFMDCSGLAPLLEARARLGGRLQLCDLPRSVSGLLHLAGLDAAFAIDDVALPATGGGAGSPSREVTGWRDDPSRTVQRAAPVDEDAQLQADGEDTALRALEEQTASQSEAIGNRVVIEQATGVLMASLVCDARQASRALQQMSWEQDVPVRDVALALVAAAQRPRSPASATEVAATVDRARS